MQIRLDFCDPRAPLDASTTPASAAALALPRSAPAQPDPTPAVNNGQTLSAGPAPQASSALRCAFEAPIHTLVAHEPNQVKPLLDAVQAFANQGFWCVGYLRYEAASAFDAALQTHPADGPLAWFGVFDAALPWPEPATGNPARSPQSDAAAPAQAAPGKTAPARSRPVAEHDDTRIAWHSRLTRTDFERQMTHIHQAIRAGEIYQLNYTAPLHGTLGSTRHGTVGGTFGGAFDGTRQGSAVTLFQRLQQAQPGGYAAFIDSGFEQVLSVSPELFFDWDGQRILTRPMKGTAPRGSSPADDAALALQLTRSPKERSENVMIVDLLRNDLSRIALPHSVKVPALFQVQSLPTVHQMVSDVTALTRPGTTLAEVFGALFPCGSVTGAPKVRAMQLIRTLEPQPRGIYCGAIGVVRPGGHATFNVAIRSVTLKGDQALCGIGSGITADAQAEAEWQEWQHKRRFLERAAEPFSLLETLRLQDGVFHLLDLHLARLQRSAAHFGYPFEAVRIHVALQTLTAAKATATGQTAARLADSALPGECWRVRLLCDAQGTPQLESYKLNHPTGPVLLALAATPFESYQSEFSQHKTTRRAHYDAFAPTDPALFDTLLYNPRGELTECTRGNIAVLLDGQWLTPALHCGLLPGVGRAHWLQQGRLREAVITLADLKRAPALAFVNSLRGWLAACLQDG